MNIEELREEAVLLFDKPYRWTSFDLVKKIKFALRAKVGHCGTLDPLASGLLIICTGKATKKVESIQAAEKEYTGVITLGATTASHDMETDVDQTFPTEHITEQMIHETAQKFIGVTEQMPPVHSAKKLEGKRYYEMTREGQAFERKTSKVELKEFEITKIDMPHVHFRIVTGKGYYVRSMAHDFGLALGSGGYLSELRRTRIGEYKVDDAWKIDAFVKELKASPGWR